MSSKSMMLTWLGVILQRRDGKCPTEGLNAASQPTHSLSLPSFESSLQGCTAAIVFTCESHIEPTVQSHLLADTLWLRFLRHRRQVCLALPSLTACLALPPSDLCCSYGTAKSGVCQPFNLLRIDLRLTQTHTRARPLTIRSAFLPWVSLDLTWCASPPMLFFCECFTKLVCVCMCV